MSTPSDWGVYAYVCTECDHLANRHTLTPDATSVEGFYQCPCGCNITQRTPLRGIKRDEYDASVAALIPEDGAR